MYKFVVVSVIALVVFQGALAKPKAKQGAAPVTEQSQIDKLAEQAHEIVRNVSHAIEGNIPDSKQVSDSLTQTSQTLADKIKGVTDELVKQTQEHKGDIENVLNSIKENLSTTATKLQNAIGPEATQKAKELKANLDEGINKAITEAQRLAKAAEPEIGKAQSDLNNVAKDLLNQIVEVAKSLQTELNKNVTPPK